MNANWREVSPDVWHLPTGDFPVGWWVEWNGWRWLVSHRYHRGVELEHDSARTLTEAKAYCQAMERAVSQ